MNHPFEMQKRSTRGEISDRKILTKSQHAPTVTLTKVKYDELLTSMLEKKGDEKHNPEDLHVESGSPVRLVYEELSAARRYQEEPV